MYKIALVIFFILIGLWLIFGSLIPYSNIIIGIAAIVVGLYIAFNKPSTL